MAFFGFFYRRAKRRQAPWWKIEIKILGVCFYVPPVICPGPIRFCPAQNDQKGVRATTGELSIFLIIWVFCRRPQFSCLITWPPSGTHPPPGGWRGSAVSNRSSHGDGARRGGRLVVFLVPRVARCCTGAGSAWALPRFFSRSVRTPDVRGRSGWSSGRWVGALWRNRASKTRAMDYFCLLGVSSSARARWVVGRRRQQNLAARAGGGAAADGQE